MGRWSSKKVREGNRIVTSELSRPIVRRYLEVNGWSKTGEWALEAIVWFDFEMDGPRKIERRTRSLGSCRSLSRFLRPWSARVAGDLDRLPKLSRMVFSSIVCSGSCGNQHLQETVSRCQVIAPAPIAPDWASRASNLLGDSPIRVEKVD
jgi:hypothetical protein